MEFRILGPVEVRGDDDSPVVLGGGKQRALLALLLLNPNKVISTDQLIDELWHGEPPETARKALQVHVSNLRKALGDKRITTEPPGYRLRVDEGELDLDRFETLRAEGDPESLREALALWRGPPLANFAYEPFAQAEIARLEELRLNAVEQRIEADLELGRHGELAPELEHLIAAEPLRERLRAQLMLALYRSGRQAEALDAYQVARRVLVDELGIEPGRALQDLERAILRQEPSLEWTAPPEASGPVRPRPARPRPGAAFVGRDSELDECRDALDQALAGRGRLLLISGEPGIGKSRLAEEVAGLASELKAEVLLGRSWEAGGAPPYWPWAQALRDHVRRRDQRMLRVELASAAADVATVVPEVRMVLPDVPETSPSESEGARFRLFDAVAAFLEAASKSQPLVICLDDLHAADTPSLLLLQFVAGELERMSVLIVGAYRDVDPAVSPDLAAAVTELSRRQATKRIALGGLSLEEVHRFVDLHGGAGAPESLSAKLYDDTEGNPLFLGEMLRLLAAEGRLDDTSQRVRVPDSVREVIGRRLRDLSSECRRVLTLASVLGREFGLVAVQRVADYTGIDKLLEVLDEAIATRVIVEVPGSVGRLRFAHALIGDSLYSELPTTHRVRLHRRVAEVLEELYRADPEPHLAELAHHFLLAVPAVESARAADYARRAGDRAFTLLAYEESGRLYRAALESIDLAGSSDEQARCELLLLLGEAESRAGNTSVAKETFLAAAAIARQLGLPRELARAAAGYGGRIVWGRAGDDKRLVPLLEEGLVALGDEDVELRVRLLSRLGGALRDQPSRDLRDRLSAEAVELARREGHPAGLVYALDGRAYAIRGPDTADECLALANELLEAAEVSGNSEGVLAAYGIQVNTLLQLGDIRGAEAALTAANRLANELRQPARIWEVGGLQAMLAVSTGRLDEAEELSSRTLAQGERAVPDAAIPAYRLQRYTLCDFRGNVEEVEQAIRDLVVEHPGRPIFRCTVAHLEARLGRLPEARRALADLSADGFSGLPFDQEWLLGMSLLGEASALADDTATAPLLYDLLAPWAAFNAIDPGEGMRGSVSRYLGLLAATMERVDEAASHFQDALEMNSRMGARPWLAHTQRDYAQTLLARGQPGDRERAQSLAAEALATYRELGMTPWIEWAEALVRSIAE